MHWYLVQDVYTGPSWGNDTKRIVLDPTAAQFKTAPPYHLGRGRGFLTKGPSKRARAMMDAMLWQGVPGA